MVSLSLDVFILPIKSKKIAKVKLSFARKILRKNKDGGAFLFTSISVFK